MLTRRKILALPLATALISFAPTHAIADEPVKVVATFSILADMAERIGGEHVEVVSLVGRGGDSHVFRPSPSDAQALADADILLENGLGFEGWIERLEEASGFDGKAVIVSAGVTTIEGGHDHGDHGHDDHGHDDHDDHGHDEEKHAEKDGDHDHNHDHDGHGHDDHDHGKEKAEKASDDHDHDHDHDPGDEKDKEASAEGDHDHDHDHDHGEEKHAEKEGDHDHDEHGHDDHAGHSHGEDGKDPHAWNDVENARIYAANIADALAAAVPGHADDIRANAEAYDAELAALDAELDTLFADLPEDHRTVVTSHEAFGYFGEAYNLRFLAAQGFSTEAQPSAAEVAEIIRELRELGHAAIFFEATSDQRLVQRIAEETDLTVGGTLFPEALSALDGPAPTYIDMIRHNATQIAEALKD